MLGPERHRLILELLEEKNVVNIAELTTALNASDATIRRDLVQLAGEGRLKRIHGGAQRLEPESTLPPRRHVSGGVFLADKERNTRQKQLIARRAVEMCTDGESVIINGGSSTFMMAEHLADRRLNILTNSFPLALELIETSDNRISLPGGEYYPKQKLILSSFDEDNIRHYHGVRMFMGTPGIGKYGVMESDPLLVRAELKLLAQADELVVLADSSKIGKRSNLILCELDRVSTLITDSGADPEAIEFFRRNGLDVLVVHVDEEDAIAPAASG